MTVSGNTLTIRLTKVAPDFISRMAMNFMCAVPPNLPIDPQGVNTPPGAGPYYVSSKKKGAQIVLRKNPYYGGKRRQIWDVIRVTVEAGEQASYLQVRKGEADLDLYSLPTAAHTQLTKEFGINKGRYFVHPSNSIGYFALNTSRGFFKDARARQAVAFAVDRPAITRLGGLNGGTPNEQILPPGIPGYRDANIYPVGRPNLAKAKALLGGKTGKVVMYTTNDQLGVNTGQLLQANLKAIGLDVEVKPYTFAVLDRQGGHPRRPVRHRLDRLVRGLSGPVRLHQHPARRADDRREEQRQPLLLRLAGVPAEDGHGSAAHGRCPLPRVREPRHRHHAQPVAARDHEQPERPGVHLGEGRLRDLLVRLGRPQPRDALPEEVSASRDPAAPSRGNGAARWSRYRRPA